MLLTASVIFKSLNSNRGLKSGSVLSNPSGSISGFFVGFFYPSKKHFSSSYVTNAVKNSGIRLNFLFRNFRFLVLSKFHRPLSAKAWCYSFLARYVFLSWGWIWLLRPSLSASPSWVRELSGAKGFGFFFLHFISNFTSSQHNRREGAPQRLLSPQSAAALVLWGLGQGWWTLASNHLAISFFWVVRDIARFWRYTSSKQAFAGSQLIFWQPWATFFTSSFLSAAECGVIVF